MNEKIVKVRTYKMKPTVPLQETINPICCYDRIRQCCVDSCEERSPFIAIDIMMTESEARAFKEKLEQEHEG